MEKRELICICCPLGCFLTVTMEENNIKVSGNTCPKGKQYALEEVMNPRRILTTTLPVKGGEIPMVSVKTKESIPKSKLFDCMKALVNIDVEAPINIGDVIIYNLAETNVSLIATQRVLKNIESFNHTKVVK